MDSLPSKELEEILIQCDQLVQKAGMLSAEVRPQFSHFHHSRDKQQAARRRAISIVSRNSPVIGHHEDIE